MSQPLSQSHWLLAAPSPARSTVSGPLPGLAPAHRARSRPGPLVGRARQGSRGGLFTHTFSTVSDTHLLQPRRYFIKCGLRSEPRCRSCRVVSCNGRSRGQNLQLFDSGLPTPSLFLFAALLLHTALTVLHPLRSFSESRQSLAPPPPSQPQPPKSSRPGRTDTIRKV